ncbi:MAG: Gfo/Idh/MocA family oxidoreductase [Bacteroidales bacterium]|nr:Gfo/Idh/MocA family oxidoreductase [Bacteroidales bacterium]
MKKINIALIGTGYIADYHARGLLDQAGVNLTGVAAATGTSVEKFAARYHIEGVLTTDVSSLADRDDVDAVVIGTPNKFHAPYALEFLRKGKDVFLEKPMAMNAAEGEEIMKTAKETGRLVMVGHMWRFDEEVNYMKKVVLSGALGKIVKSKGYGIHVNWGPEGWFTKKELSGGGALIDMGVHAIDTVRYILGDPDPVSVYARIETCYGEYDVDDTGVLVITWNNGTISIIESGWWQPHMDGPEAATRLFGTKGYGSVFPTFIKKNDTREDYRLSGPAKTEHCDQRIYTRQMEHFIACIRNRQQPSPGITEGQTIMKIVDAAYLSAQYHKVIRL